MARYYFPGHDRFRLWSWADRQRSTSRPYLHPLPYYRFIGTEKSGKVFQVGPLWEWSSRKPGDYLLIDPEVQVALCNSDHYVSWLDQKIWQNDKAKADNKALVKLDADLAQVANLFEDWYERQQSYKLLMQAGKEILLFLENWRKPVYWKRFAGKVKQPSSLPEAWLTVQFGVKPLVGTVDTMLHNLGRPLKDAKFKETSGTSRHHAQYTPKDPFNRHVEFTLKYRKTIGLFVRCNPNPNLGLMNVVGLGMPYSTTFQVLPWGWAVDYFANVSQLLSNFESKHPGVEVYGHWSTVKYDLDFVQQRYLGDGLAVKNVISSHQMTRTTNLDTPRYQPTWSFPLLGSNQLANLFSAIALSMKKGK